MSRDNFNFRKKNQLNKIDKSLKGDWDLRIKTLCENINSLDDFYTTSSCSGRVVILKDSREKREDLFLFVSHELINFENLKKKLESILDDGLIYFKCEPCILHVACKSLEDCKSLMDKAMKAGWKRNGVVAMGKRFVVELNATSKLEFPLINNGNVLVDDDFLELIVSEANRKLKESWEKIERLKELI